MSSEIKLPGKLVRDNIPEIIKNNGATPIFIAASSRDQYDYIKTKLQEEVNEYLESEDTEELADIIEVCFAAAAIKGIDMLSLLIIAYKKRLEKGAFNQNIIWLGNKND
jgi:predicted house-cleaning noncanonical NTP pyrophosphatase (MazG superfamily)